MTGRRLRLAVDVGGTFTDVTFADPADGRLISVKVSTTPGDLAGGVLDGIAAALDRAGAPGGEVADVVHGSTTGTNALIDGAVTLDALGAGFDGRIEITLRGGRVFAAPAASLATDPAKVVAKFRANAAAALAEESIDATISLLQDSGGIDVAALAPILASAAVR